MKKFRFYVDQRIKTWERTRFAIEAEDKKEAVKKAIEFLKDSNECLDNVEVEILYETSTEMDVEENRGAATRELFSEDGQEISNNTE